MTTDSRSREELLAENADLRYRLDEAEETLHAIRSGAVDALVVSREEGADIFTLQGAEHPYRVLVESMNEGAVTLSPEGDILYCNRSLAAMLQVPLEKLFGTPLAFYVAPADRHRFAGNIAVCGAGCEKEEISLIAADGNTVPVLFSCCGFDLSGSYGISVVLTDIRYQKQAEASLREAQIQARVAEERERAAEALQESEHKFRLLFESSPDAVFLTIPDGTILAANPAACAMFGMSEKELCGVGRQGVSDPHDPRHAAIVEKRGREGRILKAELSFLRKNGERFIAEVDSVILSEDLPRSFVILRDIDARKQAEEQLRLSEEKFSLAFANNPAAITLTRVEDGVFIEVNETWMTLTGWSRDEAIGRSARIMGVWPCHEDAARFVAELKVKGSLRGWEQEFRKKSGEPYTAQLSAQVLTVRGEMLVLSTIIDITERKRAEEELHAAHRRLNAVLEQMSDGFATFDKEWRYTYINSAASKAFKVAPEQLLGKTIWEMWPPAYDLPVGLNFRRAMDENIPINFETYYPAPLDRWFECRCHPTTEGLATFFTDITDRKHVEEALKESEERFRVAQELSPDGFTILRPVRDGQGRVVDFTWVYQNAAIERMTGHAHGEVIGRRLLEVMPGHIGSAFFEAYLQVAETGEPKVLEACYQGDTITTLTWFRVAVVRMNRDLAILAQDVTERKRAEVALRQAHDDLELRVEERTAELREKDQMLLVQGRQAAMGEMIGNIAHQWRQPLNSLGLAIQGLLLSHELGELDRECLESSIDMCMSLIRHMSETIDDFRNYFKPDKEKAEFKLSDAVAKTLALIDDSFKNQHISVDVISDSDRVIFGYRNEFAQVVLNILNNARDVLMERRIVSPKVTITLGGEGEKAVLTIADNAGGIPDTVLGKIFDPYFTTKGPQQGTGVGLYMSKTIIEKNMGGRLSARNTPGGAEFRIEV